MLRILYVVLSSFQITLVREYIAFILLLFIVL